MADIINFSDYHVYKEFDFTPFLKHTRPQKIKDSSAKPERQGSLDGLCGVYCIINAINYAANLSQKQRSGLFKQLINVVKKSYGVDKCILHGTNKKLLLAMFQTAQDYLLRKHGINIEFTPLFKPKSQLSKKYYLASLANLLNSKKRILIVELSGVHEHWTCVTSVTAKTIKLLDSDGLTHLKTTHCRVSSKTNNKHHFLNPNRTWCVWLNN